MLHKVVNIPVPNLRDTPKMLRRMADRIESGELVVPRLMVVVHQDEDGKITNFGFGDETNLTELIGLLERSKFQLALDCL